MMKMNRCRGFSYLEVIVSLGIIMSSIQIFFVGIHYTTKSYAKLRAVEEAVCYGKEVLQVMQSSIEQGEYIDPDILKDYIGTREDEVKPYGYYCMIIPDIPAGESLTWEQIEKGLHFTSEEVFDLDIFKKLYDEGQLNIKRPYYKENKSLYYEGLSLKATPSKGVITTKDKVREGGRAVISLNISNGGDKVRIEVKQEILDLDEEKSIFILWEDVEHLKGENLEIEWVNHTPCKLILGVVGELEALEGSRFTMGEGDEALMIKQLQERPRKEEGYILVEVVTKRETERNTVRKTYVTIQ